MQFLQEWCHMIVFELSKKKNDLRIASDRLDFDLLSGTFSRVEGGRGACPRTP